MSDREWSEFEMQTFLALIARSIHVNGTSRAATTSVSQAEFDFAAAFNQSVNKGDPRKDLAIHEILDKLDDILTERKHVIGEGGLIARGRAARITRFMTMAFRRNRDMDFDGSTEEWKSGRNKEVVNKHRKGRGLDPLPDSAFKAAVKETFEVKVPQGRRKGGEIDPGRGDTARAPKQYSTSCTTHAPGESTKRKVREPKPVVWGNSSSDEESDA